MPHSARRRHFLGNGRDGAIPGAEILKRRLSSEQWLEWHKAAIWHLKIIEIILHLLHQLQYWPRSALSYKDSTYIKQLEFWFIPWLFRAWTITIMFVPSYFFFFFQPHSTRLFRASLLALFLIAVSLLFASFFPHSYSPICVQLHMKSILEVQCITAIIQEPQGNSGLQPSVYSPVHLLSLYHSCYPNTPSFFCTFKI